MIEPGQGMQFHVVTLFPEMVAAWAAHGVVGRAMSGGLLRLEMTNPREYAEGAHRAVDDRPYGGGPGMVMQVGPLRRALSSVRAAMPAGSTVIALGPQGRVFDQAVARSLSAAPGLVLVCGRYEGIDERLLETDVDLELSLGDYVISGGELAALVVADAVARLVPGVLGAVGSADQDSFSQGWLDCPHYTRPEEIDGQRVPEVLLSGDHAAIRRWRLKQSLGRTWQRRPDLLEGRELDREQRELLDEYIAETLASRRERTR